jgi:hypothetical protein
MWPRIKLLETLFLYDCSIKFKDFFMMVSGFLASKEGSVLWM